ncbi:hypothetical protein Dvina_07940 [Dactylosporangium vinaceum]|uniref:Uncharacterized protein n=1 Tax=Dactylosporangium vinaceum TaxID=53362 RepID=A0ABV5M709_9ACTN|nr:hypothetical protein [Dactylosporangium vinaceum]UAB98022.1 hypothetical protein Dvina_07940 [Dactylosporangium vinaceum]
MDDGVPREPAEPPLDPPLGCADPMLWRVARALHDAHRPRTDNFCECKAFWPCADAQLADEALQLAYDRHVRGGRPAAVRNSNLGRWSA